MRVDIAEEPPFVGVARAESMKVSVCAPTPNGPSDDLLGERGAGTEELDGDVAGTIDEGGGSVVVVAGVAGRASLPLPLPQAADPNATVAMAIAITRRCVSRIRCHRQARNGLHVTGTALDPRVVPRPCLR